MLFMFFSLITIAQGVNVPPPPPPQPPPPGLPIDSGIAVLFVVTLVFGVYKAIKISKKLKA